MTSMIGAELHMSKSSRRGHQPSRRSWLLDLSRGHTRPCCELGRSRGLETRARPCWAKSGSDLGGRQGLPRSVPWSAGVSEALTPQPFRASVAGDTQTDFLGVVADIDRGLAWVYPVAASVAQTIARRLMADVLDAALSPIGTLGPRPQGGGGSGKKHRHEPLGGDRQ